MAFVGLYHIHLTQHPLFNKVVVVVVTAVIDVIIVIIL